MRDRNTEKEKELAYYVSLGYTQKQAARIAAMDFERPYTGDGFGSNRRFSSGGGRILARPLMAMKRSSGPAAGAVNDALEPERCMVFTEPSMPSEAVPGAGPFPGVDIEDVRSDEYEHIEETGVQSTDVSPTSTFRTTFNTAAASILLGNFRNGTGFSHDMVRTEELLNFVPYDLKEAKDRLFEVTKELSREGDRGFLFLGIKARDVLPARKNIVLLIDTSGSMSSKTLQIRATLATVFASLRENDVFSIVTYSSEDKTFINGMKVGPKHGIDWVLDQLKEMYIEGCTNGSKGIETAYTIVEENYIDDGINRVILVTDGDLNFGITDKGGLIDLISKKRGTGAYLSCIGTGLYNLRDDKLDALAKNGNGNYFVVNGIADVKEILRKKYGSLVFPVAKNVKAQVEFNPAAVRGYKLIGYENRRLTHEQFRDDAVVAEPFGSGAYCAACYELYFSDPANVKPLKYRAAASAASAADGAAADGSAVAAGAEELATLTLRYQDVRSDEFSELEFVIDGSDSAPTENTAKAKECARIADVLRGGDTEGKKRRAIRDYLNLFAGTEYAESFEE